MNYKTFLQPILEKDPQNYSQSVMSRNGDLNYWENRCRIAEDNSNEDSYLGILTKELRTKHELYLSSVLENKHVFEISCGNGYWIKKFFKKTLSYDGMEPTKNLYNRIPLEFQKNILNNSLSDLIFIKKYDIIFETISVSSFYNHLTDVVCEKIHASLQDSGKIVFLECYGRTNAHIIEVNKDLSTKVILL
jgi:hypothetical protein